MRTAQGLVSKNTYLQNGDAMYVMSILSANEMSLSAKGAGDAQIIIDTLTFE